MAQLVRASDRHSEEDLAVSQVHYSLSLDIHVMYTRPISPPPMAVKMCKQVLVFYFSLSLDIHMYMRPISSPPMVVKVCKQVLVYVSPFMLAATDQRLTYTKH